MRLLPISGIIFFSTFYLSFLNNQQPIIDNFYNQDDTYESLWEKVDSLKNIGLNRSAYDVCAILFDKAKAEHNLSEFSKSLMYKMRFFSYTEEDSHVKLMGEIEKEVSLLSAPLKQYTYSVLAQMYWDYYQSNRYNIIQRSVTSESVSDDVNTWDGQKFTHHIIKLYLSSLQEEEKLKKIPVNQLDKGLLKQKDSERYRPTLYDFLCFRAIAFFSNNDAGLTKPKEEFIMDNLAYFYTLEDFKQLTLTTPDTQALKFYALQLYQKQSAFHLKDKSPDALVDGEIHRLSFIHRNYVGDYNDSLYLDALVRLKKRFIKHEISADIMFEEAKFYYEKGEQYIPFEQPENQWELKKAIELCDVVNSSFPHSWGAGNCKALKDIIAKQSLSFIAENIYPANRSFKVKAEYKNIDKIYFKLVKLDYWKYIKENRRASVSDKINKLLNSEAVLDWNVEVPNKGDYQNHSAEIAVEKNKTGYYMLLASSEGDFETYVSYHPFWVSNLSYVSKRIENKYQLTVLNRNSGVPIANVEAQVWYEKYDYIKRDYKQIKGETYKTDSGGFIEIKDVETNRNFMLELNTDDDRLVSNERFYQNKPWRAEPKSRQLTYFFTDRAIYRPGQTIYFKGIILKKENEENTIEPGTQTTVNLYDVNHQVVSTQTFVANEYGSFSGAFILPTAVLNGQMHLANESGSFYFSVEEYKRPQFEVGFKPIQESFKLNEDINIVAFAKTYSGANLTDAKVKYRVVRNASYPYCGFMWYRMPVSPEKEIKNGNAETNEKGECSIVFSALPDKKVSDKYAPVFVYTVYVTITDLNGETHSKETIISVGKQSLIINTDIPEMIDQTSSEYFDVSISNLNGQLQEIPYSVKVFKLISPMAIFRSRQWSQSDEYVIDKKEYESLFPYDVYSNEDDISTWEEGELMLSNKYEKSKNRKVQLHKLSKWNQGYYVAKFLAVDQYGVENEYKKYFRVFNPQSNTFAFNELFKIDFLNSLGEVGDSIPIYIGSADTSMQIVVEIGHKNNISKHKTIVLNKEQILFYVPVKEDYRGGFSIYYHGVKRNRVFTGSQLISVPWSNKKLDIEFETFRDKTIPGSKEEWKIKVKGDEGEKIAAEMLATLYDASLDEFRVNSWQFNLYPTYSTRFYYSNNGFSTHTSALYYLKRQSSSSYINKYYHQLNWYGYSYYGWYAYDDVGDIETSGGGNQRGVQMKMTSSEYEEDRVAAVKSMSVTDKDGAIAVNGKPGEITHNSSIIHNNVTLRNNFNETAFFYPHLKTDKKGDVIISFTIPDALTKWKMIGLAHTKDLKTGIISNEMVTQKELMIVPNAPRFFREGDRITFSAKITNLSKDDLEGTATLTLKNAINGKNVSHLFLNSELSKAVKISSEGNAVAEWHIKIPEGIEAVSYQATIQAGNYTDGEEKYIPILTNRMLVTESMPLPIRGKQSKEFTFNKLLFSDTATTLKHHKLTLEFTSNPAWYAVQALPYMMEYPYECAEQIFSRFYANSLATHIVNSKPEIKKTFEIWKIYDSDAFLSNLEKNSELKSLVLEASPWVMQAQNETERKKRMALLFDINKMSNKLNSASKKLNLMQTSNGGWPWFKGMKDDRYITQYIVSGYGHLEALGIDIAAYKNHIIKKAVHYLDNRIKEDYDDLKRITNIDMNDDHLGNFQIQYLYARSFYTDIDVSITNKKAFDYYLEQSKKYWLNKSRYMQGMIALVLNRNGDNDVAMEIVNSLKENAIQSEEMGMYWKEFNNGYYWYQASIESQALMIEVFNEISGDIDAVNEMRIWLLKQKQTQDWKTTKATAEACYALLLTGTDWLSTESDVQINIGEHLIDPGSQSEIEVEAGTAYFKTSWNKDEVSANMGNIQVVKKGNSIGWGALYWQYFENLDKITPHETPLKINKKLFIEKNTDAGKVIVPIEKKDAIKLGDKIVVRIELRVDRNMEYIHMKDMRASCFEPVNVISGYKYREGLGYYESTGDASTDFFFSYFPKGTYVFEYGMIATQKGEFSNGITNIQCMYAPEFSSHSEGVRVIVK